MGNNKALTKILWNNIVFLVLKKKTKKNLPRFAAYQYPGEDGREEK